MSHHTKIPAIWSGPDRRKTFMKFYALLEINVDVIEIICKLADN